MEQQEEEALAIDESCCSTPYVSAPSSPTRTTTTGFYYSAPASPMHFLLSTNATLNNNSHSSSNTDTSSFDFNFNFTSAVGSSSSATADELFINGQIRPTTIKLSPLLESNDQNQNQTHRGRELKSRTGSLRRRTRSESPSLKNNNLESQNDAVLSETTSRSSKRWIFLKDLLLYRSKSEGRKDESGSSSSSNRFFWNTVPVKEKKKTASFNDQNVVNKKSGNSNNKRGKRRSAHEVHYAVKRAEAEEMRKKTFLPYRQGLLGCLGFSSKSYGAVNGFARALNPVSSR